MRTSQTTDCNGSVLFMAMELSHSTWKLAFSTGVGRKARRRDVMAGNLTMLMQEIEKAKRRFQLSADIQVVSCFEAGRDGFWIHRFLTAQGVKNVVIDPASLEINRRNKHVKTDRLDVDKLLVSLMRWAAGDESVWSVVNPPSPEQEDQRQLHRELETLKKEQTSHNNRIKGLLKSLGLQLNINRHLPEQVDQLKDWNGQPLPDRMKQRVLREFHRMQLVNQQIRQLEKERAELIRAEYSQEGSSNSVLHQVVRLMELSAVSVNSSWLFVHEVFGWREVKNRKQLGALVGLAPTPYSSGQLNRDQGISKAGNRRMRTMAVEIAWCWTRYQPESQLSQWYQRRFAQGSKRQRRIGIVALARKLMIAFWKYLKDGEIPAGARLKAKPCEFRYTPSLS